jgi:hypothetical protein
MKSYRNYLILFVSLTALIVLIAAVTPAKIKAGAENNDSKDVLVVNTTSDPVPVSMQGTTQVRLDSLANTVRLDDVQNKVKVDGTVKIDADSVKQPYRSQVHGNFEPGISNVILQFGSVPANKRLVIEHVADKAMVIGVDAEVFGELGLDDGDPSVATDSFHLEMHYQANSSSVRIFTTSQPIKIYANAGEMIFLNVSRVNANNGGILQGIITGYLVDVP